MVIIIKNSIIYSYCSIGIQCRYYYPAKKGHTGALGWGKWLREHGKGYSGACGKCIVLKKVYQMKGRRRYLTRCLYSV